MFNQVVIVEKLKEINKEEDRCEIKLSVTRCFKNADGEYDVDIIPCTLWKDISQNANKYLKIGDIVGIRGSLQSVNSNIFVVAEKITFLSSKKEEE